MTSSGALLRRTFSALSIHNFRLYFGGQVVSVSGTWMQRVAQSWLVLELTDSGAAVGALTAVQFLPILLLASTGGLFADRMDKRTVLYVTQSLASLIALTLGVLVLTGTVELWMVFALALTLGVVGSFDNPARQSFVMEMVGRSKLANAVALNSVLVNTARIIGPAVGGILIVTVGIGFCFLINSGTYLVFIAAIAAMRGDDIDRPEPEPRERGQLREALRYVRDLPVIRSTLVMSAVVGLFAYEFEVVLPLLARFTFGGDADTFGTMFAFMGFGAVLGGLYVATRNETPPRLVLFTTYAFGVTIAATAIAPVLWVSYIALVLVGVTSTAFLTSSNSVLQLRSAPQMKGRVVGLRATAILGARPIGAPIVGWIGEHLGPRFGLGLGAVAALGVAVWAHSQMVGDRTPAPKEP
ncbi:MAG TPA: MFS transporter [Acidimicrobiia bacterium]|nr:MFS transporter [Acidimicrobiia bacterium]